MTSGEVVAPMVPTGTGESAGAVGSTGTVEHVVLLPDVGEGLIGAEVVAWRVQVGQLVAVHDPLVEIETAKSLVELPSPFAGRVSALHAEVGQELLVGRPLVTLLVGAATAAAAAPVGAEPEPANGSAVESNSGRGAGGSILVGYGPRAEGVSRALIRPRTAVVPGVAAAAPAAPAAQVLLAPRSKPLAKPLVRQLARSLGVNLTEVRPSSPTGVISKSDVLRQAEGLTPTAVPPGPASAQPADHVVRPAENAVQVSGVRRATAEAMVRSAFTAPHATEWLSVDVTRTQKLVTRLRGRPEFDGVRLTTLAVVSKAVAVALIRYPRLNSSWRGETGQIVEFSRINLGLAMATERGLLVPTLPDAGRLSLLELARELQSMASRARSGALTPEEFAGGTFTISNVGVFGVDGGTPIMPPGQGAILAVGRIARQPWVHRGKVRPRWVAQLSLSFDHRSIDGDQAGRFLSLVAELLRDPELLLGLA